MTIQTRTVVEAEADTRLDRWFRRHFPQLTQGALQKMLRTGQVRIDGKRAEANTRLAPGQEVRIPPLPDGPPPERGQFLVSGEDAEMLQKLVLHRDDSVIVLDKPHGLPVQGGPGITRHLDGMLDALRFGYEDRPRLVHRLDKDTSGVLLIARTPAAAAFLARAIPRPRGGEDLLGGGRPATRDARWPHRASPCRSRTARAASGCWRWTTPSRAPAPSPISAPWMPPAAAPPGWS